MTSSMDLVDRKLLNLLQTSFPLVHQPFQTLGQELGIAEEEIIQRIATLKRKNVVRQISAIFDTRRLGYRTTLVAARYPAASLTKAAHQINRRNVLSGRGNLIHEAQHALLAAARVYQNPHGQRRVCFAREVTDLLPRALFRQFEVVLVEVRNQPPLLVFHNGKDIDDFGCDSQGGG